jgi:hypothetical protein
MFRSFAGFALTIDFLAGLLIVDIPLELEVVLLKTPGRLVSNKKYQKYAGNELRWKH